MSAKQQLLALLRMLYREGQRKYKLPHTLISTIKTLAIKIEQSEELSLAELELIEVLQEYYQIYEEAS